MKKKLINIAAILLMGVSLPMLNSCKDAVNITEPGIITDSVLFTSVSNLNSYLIGSVYANLEPSYGMYLSAVLTDELKPGKGSGGQEFQQHRFYLDSSDGYSQTIWYQNYLVINRVNRLLAGAATITPTSNAEQTQYNSIVAQARAIRAYCYLQLETYFAPNMKDASGQGVILLDHIPTTDEKLPRSTNQQIYDFINADLAYARGVLSYGSDRYYVDKGFVNAVAARMNLYKGDYAQAKQYASDILANSGLALTQATPIQPSATVAIGSAAWNTAFYNVASSFNPYRNLWNDSARGEIIFAANRLASGVGYSIGTFWNTNGSNITGNPMWYWGRNLFNIFNNTDGDIRKYAYVDPTSIIDPNYATSSSPINTDVLIIDKYPGKTNAATRNDVKLFRLSEMYFILAECAVESGDLTGAANYIQTERVARNYKGTATTPVYTSTQVAYADILKERRVELALEGHRYIDLKRLATKAGVTMDRNATDDIVSVSNLPNDSYKYTLPIPLSEISANPNVQQNPGY